MVELVYGTYNGRCMMGVYYTSDTCNPITPSLRIILDLSSNLFLQLQLQQLTRFRVTQGIGSKASCYKGAGTMFKRE